MSQNQELDVTTATFDEAMAHVALVKQAAIGEWWESAKAWIADLIAKVRDSETAAKFKEMMATPAVNNAAWGAGIGSIAGLLSSFSEPEPERRNPLRRFLTGGLLGGTAGGVGTMLYDAYTGGGGAGAGGGPGGGPGGAGGKPTKADVAARTAFIDAAGEREKALKPDASWYMPGGRRTAAYGAIGAGGFGAGVLRHHAARAARNNALSTALPASGVQPGASQSQYLARHSGAVQSLRRTDSPLRRVSPLVGMPTRNARAHASLRSGDTAGSRYLRGRYSITPGRGALASYGWPALWALATGAGMELANQYVRVPGLNAPQPNTPEADAQQQNMQNIYLNATPAGRAKIDEYLADPQQQLTPWR